MEASETYRAAKKADRVAEKNPMWKGGETAHSQGYVYKRAPHHPFASSGYVFEHRLVMEDWLRENAPGSHFLVKLGNNFYLSPEFVVHHVDEDKANNAPGNLRCLTPQEHMRLHSLDRASKR